MFSTFSKLPSSLRIGVLRGGQNSEYDRSLQSGGHILKHLSETHRPLDIFISKDGVWHISGIERSPERILKQVDVVWNTLRDGYSGEDGVQKILYHYDIPHVGSNRFSSAISLHRDIVRDRLSPFGVKMPVHILVGREDLLSEKVREIWTKIPPPLLVKSTFSGSSTGAYIVKSLDGLSSALESILSQYSSAFVEEYISGKEISCVALDDFRDKNIYTFPPIGTGERTGLSKIDTEKIEQTARKIHQSFGLSHYSKSDFVVSPRRGVYFLEVDTTPDFHEKSLLHRVLETVGVDTVHFIHHLLSLAVNKK